MIYNFVNTSCGGVNIRNWHSHTCVIRTKYIMLKGQIAFKVWILYVYHYLFMNSCIFYVINFDSFLLLFKWPTIRFIFSFWKLLHFNYDNNSSVKLGISFSVFSIDYILNYVNWSLKLLGIGIGNFKTEFIFHCHHELNMIQRIKSQVFDEMWIYFKLKVIGRDCQFEIK